MFDIGWGEFLLIGVVALIAIGPKELPGVLRSVGQWVTKIRRMAGDFQNQFQEAMREAEMADLKKDAAKDSSTPAAFNDSYDEYANPKPGEPDPYDPYKPADDAVSAGADVVPAPDASVASDAAAGPSDAEIREAFDIPAPHSAQQPDAAPIKPPTERST
jgi:sec-independent protein translocase protein TatB